MNTISRTLALLRPADLFPAWKWIDMMEQCGEIERDEARRRKEGIYVYGLASAVAGRRTRAGFPNRK